MYSPKSATSDLKIPRDDDDDGGGCRGGSVH
jgi:hypothetical protein